MTGRALGGRHRLAFGILLLRIAPCRNLARSRLSAMTLNAPAHGQRRILINPLHLLHRAMAGLAAHPGVDVIVMGEDDEIRKLVDANPLDGLSFAISLR